MMIRETVRTADDCCNDGETLMSRSMNLISVAGLFFGLGTPLLLCMWMSAEWFRVAA